MTDIRPERSPLPERVCVGALVVLHLVLADQVSVLGATPGFLLVAACVTAVSGGRMAGTVAGFVLGLLFDLTGSGPVGLSSLLYSVCGYVLGGASLARLGDGLSARAPLCCAALLACHLAYPLFLLAFGTTLDLGWALVGRVVAGTLLDALVCAACLWALDALQSGHGSGGMKLG